MPSSPILVAANSRISFFLMLNNISLCVCSYKCVCLSIFLLYPFTLDGNWGCFCVLAIVNNATWTWEYKYLSDSMFPFLLDTYPEVKLLDHMVVLFLVFWGTSIVFSAVAVPAYILIRIPVFLLNLESISEVSTWSLVFVVGFST